MAGTVAEEQVRLSIKIGGEAGYGIVTSGTILAKAFARCGLSIRAYSEVPSLIRGGHNAFQVCVATHKIRSIWEKVNFLIALDRATIDFNIHNMLPNGSIVYDSDEIEASRDELDRDDIELLPIPMASMIQERRLAKVMKNSVALGVAISLARYDFDILGGVIADTFAAKGEKVVSANVEAARKGYQYIQEECPEVLMQGLEALECGMSKRVMTGNHALALGALRAGMTFYAGYPMTPASPLLHWLVQKEEDYGIVVKQTEDEIAAIHMVIGASAAGARAMTGTSGGGFCLMTEALGLAGMAEVPIVVVLGQRPGPATGLATRTEQGDLFFAIHASQGEFPRAVFTPGDNPECFKAAFDAFNIAERYQTPVIILGDRVVMEGLSSTGPFLDDDLVVDRGKLLTEEEARASLEDGHYKRYALTEDGVSPRAPYGYAGVVVTNNGNEHNEYGDTLERRYNRIDMMEKRLRKFEGIVKEMPPPVLYGAEDAEVTLVGWGSSKGPSLEAIRILSERGRDGISYLHFPSVWPMDGDAVREVLESCGRLVDVETNATGQFAELLAREAGVRITDRILRYDGRPTKPVRLISGLKGVMGW
jgi:2-oxoglutarate ferredoxin oxidoreductase subunit alpha